MQVSLRWTDPELGATQYDLDLVKIPVKTSDGSACPPLVPGVNDACGVSMSADKETAVQFPLVKEFAELKTLADGLFPLRYLLCYKLLRLRCKGKSSRVKIASIEI